MKFIKKLIGALEFIRGVDKYCLWIEDKDKDEAMSIISISERVEATKLSREQSKRVATQKLAKIPHQFGEIRYQKSNSIIFPSVSSERREYVPIGFLDDSYVIVAPNFAIYNASPYHLSILTSRMHMTWLRTIAGRLKTDYRYSSTLVYNTFPFPTISKQRKEELTQYTLRIIDERLKHSEKTLAQLYDPDKMPEGLKEAHHQNDLAVERCYRSTPFSSDEERLEYLFKLYEKMIQEEKDKDTLFAREKKTRKRK